MRRDNREKSNKGFTLVELIVVLVILAVLAAILSPALLGYIDEARNKRYFENAAVCVEATQAMFSRQYGLNGHLEPGTPVVSGAGITSNPDNDDANLDQDISNTPFAKDVLQLAGLPEGTPYFFMVAVGSNAGDLTDAEKKSMTEMDKYIVYYAIYIEKENSKPWYYYNGTWTTTNPRYNGKEGPATEIFTSRNVIKDGYPHAGLRLQYYVIANHNTKYPNSVKDPKFWNDWLKKMY
jgi:prepilin-type N-terminal cleavage/methylation domain-containing protein